MNQVISIPDAIGGSTTGVLGTKNGGSEELVHVTMI